MYTLIVGDRLGNLWSLSLEKFTDPTFPSPALQLALILGGKYYNIVSPYFTPYGVGVARLPTTSTLNITSFVLKWSPLNNMYWKGEFILVTSTVTHVLMI